MAVMFPREPEQGTSVAEVTVFEAFRDGLPDEWRVFHSVKWVSSTGGRRADGETDFVLAHPERGILVVEVKGGSIRVDRGEWYQRSQGPRSRERRLPRSPLAQVTDAKYRLCRRLRERSDRNLELGHGLVLPAGRPDGDLGLDCPPSIIIDKYDLADVNAAVGRVADHWDLSAPFADEFMDDLVDILAPSAFVGTIVREETRLIDGRLEEATKRHIRLTEKQLTVLQAMSRHRRTVVFGPAGSGKTLLAAERALQLARDGASVLLACHSAHLCANLRWTLWPDDRICVSEHTDVPADARFDAVVLDEAQELGRDDLGTLLQAVKPDALLFAFVDFDQAEVVQDWTRDMEHVPLVLSENCRNSREILRLAEAIRGIGPTEASVSGLRPEIPDVSHERDPSAPPPHWVHRASYVGEKLVQTTDTRDCLPILRALESASHFIDDGYAPGDIAIITTLGVDAARCRDIFYHHFKNRNLRVTALKGEEPDPRDLVVDSAAAFKGLEREVAVVIAPDDAEEQLAHAVTSVELYVAITRARAHVVVVAPPPVAQLFNTYCTRLERGGWTGPPEFDQRLAASDCASRRDPQALGYRAPD